jgi:DNA adenine methylase
LYLQRQAFGGKLDSVFGVAADRPSRFSLSRLELILEAAHERLESVIFENLDWSDLIRRCDGSKTLFYLDLPYWGGESDYRCRFAAARVALSARCPSSSRGRTRLSENICA